MSEQIKNYKCPACTGPLHFDGATGKLKCDYCETLYTVDEIEQYLAQQEASDTGAAESEQEADEYKDTQFDNSDEAAAHGWNSEEAEHMRAYSCPSCGAELICDDTTAATSCPYCGNPTIIQGQFSGALKPDYVIPFKLDKKAAKDALKAHYKGKRFLPKAFSDENHIEEIKGVYVPFWMYDSVAVADISYNAERIHTHTNGDYLVTVTEHFVAERQGNVKFKGVPVDGSSKMPDEHMDAIEPFDYKEMKPFSMAYLAGYLADKYDVGAEASRSRAEERIYNSTKDVFRDTVKGYTNVSVGNAHIAVNQEQVKYALMPIWMLSTKWKDKNFLFAMNGQTGKLIGDLPVSKGRFWGWFAGISLPLMVIVGAIMFLI